MKKLLILALACFLFSSVAAQAEVYLVKDQTVLDKEKAGGGVGVLYGKYAFTRDKAPQENAMKELVLLTLLPNETIGVHKHETNEDAYIIVSGTGMFTDADGKQYPVAAGDITIVRMGQSHALANTGKEPLVFVSAIAGK